MQDYESSDFEKIFSYNDNSYPSTITNIQLVLDIIPREMINFSQKIIVDPHSICSLTTVSIFYYSIKIWSEKDLMYYIIFTKTSLILKVV